jgi:hypothetical protein
MNCSRSTTPSGTILALETSREQIIRESRQVWTLNCFGTFSCQSSRIAQAIVCHSIRATRSTISNFDQNAVYGDDRLPGIPVHVYEAQLLYQSPLGFYAGPNLLCNLSSYPVDEANTLFADTYVLLGFCAGFRRTNGFSVFIDCRNLTNQHYAASIDVIADARTEPNPEVFHPGDGRPSTVEFPGVGESFRSPFSGNPNCLRVCELASPGGAEFASKTGTLYTAERQTRI